MVLMKCRHRSTPIIWNEIILFNTTYSSLREYVHPSWYVYAILSFRNEYMLLRNEWILVWAWTELHWYYEMNCTWEWSVTLLIYLKFYLFYYRRIKDDWYIWNSCWISRIWPAYQYKVPFGWVGTSSFLQDRIERSFSDDYKRSATLTTWTVNLNYPNT